MPVVPKDAHHHHQYRRLFHARSTPTEQERDWSQSLGHLPIDGNVELHGAFGLSAFIFLSLVVLAYLFRRHLRSVPSRLAHALPSVHAPVLNYIHIHLHTTRNSYYPLQPDAPSSPVTGSPHNSPVDEHGPAPPYATPSLGKKGDRPAKHLQITVPPRNGQVSQYAMGDVCSSSVSVTSTPSFLSDAGSSRGPSPLSTPVSLEEENQQQQKYSNEKIDFKSEASVFDLASPRASRWDAIPAYMSSISPIHKDGITSTGTTYGNPIRRVSDIMTTDSPCASPPPQYTITIHSSTRSQTSDSEGGSVVPDIVLSPVPWMPKQCAPPPSPPCYLAVPPRKSKSRHQFTSPVVKDKPLPYMPRQKQSSLSTRDAEVKSRLAFNPAEEKTFASATFTNSSPNSTIEPTPSSLPAGFRPHAPRRSATIPLPPLNRLTPSPPPPAPKPVIPLDLEAVYPSSESSDETTDESAWPWRSRTPRLPPRRLETTGGRLSFQSQLEKKCLPAVEKETSVSDEDDLPLAKGLVLAMKRKKELIMAATPIKAHRPPVSAPMKELNFGKGANVLKTQLFGRLSALAARAKSTIEQQFDSSDEEEDDEEEKEMVPVVRPHRKVDSYGARETFVIGDDEIDGLEE